MHKHKKCNNWQGKYGESVDPRRTLALRVIFSVGVWACASPVLVLVVTHSFSLFWGYLGVDREIGRERSSSTKRKMENSRSPPLPLLPKTLNHPQHLLPPATSINIPPAQTHTHLLPRMRLQQALQQQMLHLDTHKHPTITRIILLRRILQIDKPDRPAK